MCDELLEQIAEQVHIGWMQEKQRQGFADHVFNEKCPAGCPPKTHALCRNSQCYQGRSKHHADMLPYADLAENVKEYDRATVRAVFAGIEKAGYRVVAAPSDGAP